MHDAPTRLVELCLEKIVALYQMVAMTATTRILFITSTRLGDAVLTTGVLARLAQQYPDARFTIACGVFCAGLFLAAPQLERLIVIEKETWKRHWTWKQCLGVHWDLIVDLRGSALSLALRAKRRAILRQAPGRHKVIENAAVLGLDPPPSPHIWITTEAMREATRRMPIGMPILALGPLANWPPKQWPTEHFARLAQVLTSPAGAMAGAAVAVFAHKREGIATLLLSIPNQRRIEIIGSDLQTAAACLARARLFVGNDSGLMHMSAAADTPTLGLFGPGDPLIYGPWGPRCAYIRTPESREELLSRLSNLHAQEPNLMENLSVEDVAEAVKKLLAISGEGAGVTFETR